MKILYLGDIMGEPGRRVVGKLLPKLKIQHSIDFVIAQAENVSHGRGLSKRHYLELEEAGVDGFSGGNHTFERADTMEMVLNPDANVVAPANVKGKSYKNFKLINKNGKYLAIVSILGYIAPKGYNEETTLSPLHTIDEILFELDDLRPNAVVVNIHSEFSSEKVIMGQYLDGRASLVVGDHWHVPTADARILPKGTAHISDVGMCGTLNSSLGVEVGIAIERWKGEDVKNRIDRHPPYQLNAVLVDVDDKTGKANKIEQLIIRTQTL